MVEEGPRLKAVLQGQPAGGTACCSASSLPCCGCCSWSPGATTASSSLPRLVFRLLLLLERSSDGGVGEKEGPPEVGSTLGEA